jgi:3,4-dihydroxy 2-butanone 4-phosphate synthase/GTP cyclohydrolase II
MKEDGTMARCPTLRSSPKKHGLKIVTIADLIKYKTKNEKPRAPRGRDADTHPFGGEFTLMRTRTTWTKDPLALSRER